MKLKEKEFEIEGMKFKIKELDTDSALKLANVKDTEKAARMILEMSVIEPKIEEGFLKTVPARVGMEVITEINKLNGFEVEDFTIVPEALPKAPSGK